MQSDTVGVQCTLTVVKLFSSVLTKRALKAKAAELHTPPPTYTQFEIKKKNTDFVSHYHIEHFTCFVLQPKSGTDIG